MRKENIYVWRCHIRPCREKKKKKNRLLIQSIKLYKNFFPIYSYNVMILRLNLILLFLNLV